MSESTLQQSMAGLTAAFFLFQHVLTPNLSHINDRSGPLPVTLLRTEYPLSVSSQRTGHPIDLIASIINAMGGL